MTFPNKDFKFKPTTEAECEEIQKILYKFGYRWPVSGEGLFRFEDARHIYSYSDENRLAHSSDYVYYQKHKNIEMTLEELRSYLGGSSTTYHSAQPTTVFGEIW